MNEGQRRIIERTLSLLDEVLCEFEEWAKGREIHSVLYREQNTLSVTQRKELSSKTDMMKEILIKLRNTLNLDDRVRIAATAIRSHCSALWVDLTELKSNNLHRYGEIPPGLAEYLDLQLVQLIDHLNQIRALIVTK